MLKYLIFLSIFFSSIYNSIYSQVLNIDREVGSDTVKKKWEFVSGLSISSDKQQRNLFDMNSNLELSHNTAKQRVLFLILRNDAILNGKSTIQNEGMIHVRLRDRDTRRFSTEEFMQYQWNGAWGMKYRYLVGSNLRVKWLDKKTFDLYTGTGVFKEWEEWNWSAVKESLLPSILKNRRRDLYRMNNYVKVSSKIAETVDFTTTSFLQFPLAGNFWKPRWYVESNLYLNASKHMNFLIHWDHIVDTKQLVPIESFYYSFSTGIQFNF
jgi:hypothetical protein